MARPKKNVEPIVGAGKDPESRLTVQKSIPLFSLWRSDMTLAEFKILDTYLSRINSHEPEKRTVVFTKGELEQLLGVKKINKSDLLSRLKSLYRGVDIADNNKKIHTVGLFEEAYGEMDENGLWTIKLTCTSKAMKYIFNVEKLGYLRYKLRCITSLTSRYTYVLFIYLEANRFRKTWDVDLVELRQILNCDAEATYAEYKRFNDLVLKKCQKELHEKSECRFSYVPIRVGRKTTAVRFTLETLADSIEPAIPGQMTLDDYVDEDPIADALPDSITPEQAQVLSSLARKKVFWNPGGMLPLECVVADYLRHKVLLMNAHNRDIKHPFNYLKTMIEQDEDAFY